MPTILRAAMKLKTKLILSFTLVVLLVGSIGFIASYVYESVKDDITSQSASTINEIEITGDLGLQLFQSLTRTQYLIEDQYRQTLPSPLQNNDLSSEFVEQEIDRALQNFEERIQEVRKMVQDNVIGKPTQSDSSVILQQVESLEEKFEIYSSLIEELQELSSEDYSNAKEFFTITVEPYFRTTLLPLIKSLRSEIKATHETKIEALNSRLDRLSYWLVFATIVAIGIVISLTVYLYKSITDPLHTITEAARNVGQGDLNKRIDFSSNDELGQLSRTFNRMAENLSRTTVSRDYVDSIIESMADLLVVTDEEMNIMRINSAGLSMLESRREDLVGKPFNTILKESMSSLVGNGASGNHKEFTSRKALKYLNNSKNLPVSLSKGVLKDSRDEIKGYVMVASDISAERKAQQELSRSLKEKQVMLAEIHHRVKNNLAVISGLLQMQMWRSENEDAASALKESQMRVHSIALVHEKLYQTENFSHIHFDDYIQELLDAINSTYLGSNDKIQVVTELEEVVLNINQAIPCSLLLHELVVNSLKHAFSEQEDGIVQISLAKVKDEVRLKVEDNGKGLSPDDSDSLGMTLVKTLCKQLEGEIEISSNNGAIITITFTLEEVAAT